LGLKLKGDEKMKSEITGIGTGTTENLDFQHFLAGMFMGAISAAILGYVFPSSGIGIIVAIVLPVALALLFRKQPQDPQDQKKQDNTRTK
jgi:uncharacterized membrane protein YoaK (UPF0700 family)